MEAALPPRHECRGFRAEYLMRNKLDNTTRELIKVAGLLDSEEMQKVAFWGGLWQGAKAIGSGIKGMMPSWGQVGQGLKNAFTGEQMGQGFKDLRGGIQRINSGIKTTGQNMVNTGTHNMLAGAAKTGLAYGGAAYGGYKMLS